MRERLVRIHVGGSRTGVASGATACLLPSSFLHFLFAYHAVVNQVRVSWPLMLWSVGSTVRVRFSWTPKQWSRGCQYYGYLVPVAEYVLGGIGALCAHRWAAELLLVDVIMTCQG